MSSPSDLGIYAYSRHGLPHEEAELDEFVQAVKVADLQMFVEEAFYDSNSNCCAFKFRYGLTESEDVANQLLEIASNTLSQFEWFGLIHHGRWIPDE